MSYRLIFAKGHAIARAKSAMRHAHHSSYRKGEEPYLPKKCEPRTRPIPLVRSGENKDAAADVRVRVRCCVVVHVEQTVVLVLAVVTPTVQARVGSVIVPVIRDGTINEPATAAQATPSVHKTRLCLGFDK